jgi:hypothetical protein
MADENLDKEPPSPQPAKRVVMPPEVFQNILNVLGRQPYATVAQLMREIEQSVRVE